MYLRCYSIVQNAAASFGIRCSLVTLSVEAKNRKTEPISDILKNRYRNRTDFYKNRPKKPKTDTDAKYRHRPMTSRKIAYNIINLLYEFIYYNSF